MSTSIRAQDRLPTQALSSTDAAEAKPKPSRGKAGALAPVASGLPALIERVAGSVATVDDLAKLMVLKREVEAEAERRAFDQDFAAALQAEIGRVATNAWNPQKRRSYADINAVLDAVMPLVAAKGVALSFDTEPSMVPGAVRVTARLTRNGIERTALADVPMDGAGMRGGTNMSAPQAYGSSVTYGRKIGRRSCSTWPWKAAGGPQGRAQPPAGGHAAMGCDPGRRTGWSGWSG